MNKLCTKCGKIKDLSEFHKDSNAKDGHRWCCKVCDYASVKAWRRRNKIKVRLQSQKRRALKNSLKSDLTSGQILRLLVYQHGECAYCGTDIIESYTLDHIHPVTFGGHTTWLNTALVCGSCNSSKGNKRLADWIARKEPFIKQRKDVIERMKAVGN